MKKYNYTELPRNGPYRSLDSIKIGDIIFLDVAPILDFYGLYTTEYADIPEKELVSVLIQATDRKTNSVMFKKFTEMLFDKAAKLGCEVIMDGSRNIEFKELAFDAVKELEKLKNLLGKALSDEEYEKCAEYRDKIIAIENSIKTK